MCSVAASVTCKKSTPCAVRLLKSLVRDLIKLRRSVALPRITIPEKEQAALLLQLGWTLPEQAPHESPARKPNKQTERALCVADLGLRATGQPSKKQGAAFKVRNLEDAIESELRFLRENPERVRTLVGGGWIRSQVNASSN